MNSPIDLTRVNRALAVALLATLGCSAVAAGALWLIEEDGPLRATTLGQSLLLDEAVGQDSWGPMLEAYARADEAGAGTMYSVFLEDGVKFQYPPTALLPFDLLPGEMTTLDAGTPPDRFLSLATLTGRLALLVTILASGALLWIGLGHGRPRPTPEVLGFVALCGAVGLLFYPLVRALLLGQVQVYINCLLALGLLATVRGRMALAGVLIGCCALAKPHYGLALLWALLRGHRRFSAGMLGVLLAGGVLSLLRFGLDDHIAYLEVLGQLSRLGESYWPNQSFNGLVQRLAGRDPLVFSPTQFPSFNLWIYLATMASTVAFIALALWPWRFGAPDVPQELDLAIVVGAATMASPIAWEHHYGVFLALFAVVMPWGYRVPTLGRWTIPALGLAFLAVANVVWQPFYIFRTWWTGIAGSHLFFGALTLLAIMALTRRRLSNP